MPGPLAVLAVLGIGALLLGAGGGNKKAAPTPTPPGPLPPGGTPPAGWPPGLPWPLPATAPPGWPPQLPWPPTLPTVPGTPPAGAPPGGAPPSQVGPKTSTGCELDATVPPSFVPSINEALTRTDIPAVALQGFAGLCQTFGFPKTAACVSARAGQLGQAQPPPAQGTTPSGWPQERPPWYPPALPWPPPFPPPFPLPASGTPAPGQTPPAGGSPDAWGPRPAWLPATIPWPPPIPFPAAGTPAPTWWPAGLPWPGNAPATPPGGTVPPYTPGDVPPGGAPAPHEWGPRPATFPGTSVPYPPQLPWPPMGSLDPQQNPTVGTNIELQIQAGDTASGYAAYYSGPGPGYDTHGTMLENVDMGPFAARLAELAANNPQLHPEANWSGFYVGQSFYVPAHVAEVRGKPPLPSKLYQAFAGFVPRAGMTDAQVLAGLAALVGG